MLTLERSVGQAILIGRGIRMTVLEIQDGAVRLCVEAPESVAVSRDDFTLESHLQRQIELEERAMRRARVGAGR